MSGFHTKSETSFPVTPIPEKQGPQSRQPVIIVNRAQLTFHFVQMLLGEKIEEIKFVTTELQVHQILVFHV